LRRYKKYSPKADKKENGILTHAGLVIDINSREVLLNEKPLPLTPTEFSILRLLCENKNSMGGWV